MGQSSPDVVDSKKWTEAELWTTHQHGARCLAIRGVVSRLDQVPMDCLFSPTVARVEGRQNGDSRH